MEKALEHEQGSMLDPGSEFRDIDTLQPLWHKHEHWEKMKEVIQDGLTYPLEPLDPNTQKEDLIHMMGRGNHKSAKTPTANAKTLKKNYQKEVAHGWMLPIPKNKLLKMEGASAIPVGVAIQHTVDCDERRIVKRRTTHDATFSPPSTKSINNRMVKELLAECYYGHCLIRILHRIHSMRVRHPKLRILLLKIDLDAAYRRIHVTAKMAMLAVTIIENIAYILMRLPFGVANGPNDYSQISESVMDLTNDILDDSTFDPTEL